MCLYHLIKHAEIYICGDVHMYRYFVTHYEDYNQDKDNSPINTYQVNNKSISFWKFTQILRF